MKRRLGSLGYRLGLGMILMAMIVMLASAVWGLLPWFGLGGQIFLTLWLVGIIIGVLGAANA